MILCNKCGNPLDGGTSLCATCDAPAPINPEIAPRVPAPQRSIAPTEAFFSPRSEVATANHNPLPTYIIIALLALIAGGGLVALIRSPGKDTVTTVPPAANSSNVSNTSFTSPVSTPKPNSETQVKPTPTDRGSTSPPPSQFPQPSSGVWFVILGSFPRNDYQKANQRLQNVQGLGYDASIIDTDNYPGLSGGLWVVVMGPYSKSHAKSVAAQMKSVRADAYIKSGW